MNAKEIIIEFNKQIESLNGYIDSLDTIVELIVNSAKSSEEQPFIKALNNLLRLDFLNKTDTDRFITEIKEINKKINMFDDDDLPGYETILDTLAKSLSSEKFNFEYVDSKINMYISDYRTQKHFDKHMDLIQKILNQQLIVFQSALVSIINSYEFYFGKLIGDYIANNFDNLKSEQKNISYAEIFNMEDIKEVKDRIISNVTDEYMRQNNLKWPSVVLGGKKDSLKNIELELKQVNEIIQRRHIVVHNGGIVNRYYINNVEEEFRINVEYGKEIKLDRKYLKDSLNTIYMIFLKIIYYYWGHGDSLTIEELTVKFETFQKLAFEKLMKEEYKSAEEIYMLLKSDFNKYQSSEKLLFSINYCQTLKWQQKNKEFDKYFKNIDFTLATKQHEMCMHLLTDNYDNASNCLFELLNDKSEFSSQNKHNDLNYYLDWPIFKEFKNTEQFNNVVAKAGYEKEIG